MNKINYLVIAYLEKNTICTLKEISNNLQIDKALIYKSIKDLKKMKKVKELEKSRPKEVFLV